MLKLNFVNLCELGRQLVCDQVIYEARVRKIVPSWIEVRSDVTASATVVCFYNLQSRLVINFFKNINFLNFFKLRNRSIISETIHHRQNLLLGWA